MRFYINVVGTGILLGLVMLSAVAARAQTPRPDLPIDPVGAVGQYTMKLQIQSGDGQENVFEACCVRTDQLAPVDLGCNPGMAGEIAEWIVSIPVTPGDDARVQCFVSDPEQSSALSPEGYIINFTFPLLPPVLLPVP